MKHAGVMTENTRPIRMAAVIPTYNERENLPAIVSRIRAAVPTADVLVVDDNSPDGTGLVAEQLALREVQSQGYCFQVDLALRVLQSGLVVAEVPILFEERIHGNSKMNRMIVLEALWRITRWGIALRWRSLTGAPAKRSSRLQSNP